MEFYPYKPCKQASQGHIAGNFPHSGPDQIPSWSVFKILIKACLNLAKMVELVFLMNFRINSVHECSIQKFSAGSTAQLNSLSITYKQSSTTKGKREGGRQGGRWEKNEEERLRQAKQKRGGWEGFCDQN